MSLYITRGEHHEKVRLILNSVGTYAVSVSASNPAMKAEFTLHGVNVAHKVDDMSILVLDKNNQTISSVAVDSPDNDGMLYLRSEEHTS